MSYDEAFYEAHRKATNRAYTNNESLTRAIQQHAAAILVAAEKLREGLDGITRALETQDETPEIRVDLQGGSKIAAAINRGSKALEELENTYDRRSIRR